MGKVKIKFLGSGDAFGSGGRLQACILIKTEKSQFLLDCGASSLSSMRRFNVSPNDIDMILLTHLHGDHFGGIPFFILDAQLISKRTRPLIIAGPAGTEQRIKEVMEVMFPGSSKVQQRFSVGIIELEPGKPQRLEEIEIIPFLVEHPSGAPALALRLECQGKIITYTGDTEWTSNLIKACQGADLLIAEAYFYQKKIRFHMDYQTLMGYWNKLQAKRLIITHLSQDMLMMLGKIECEYAEDGKEFDIE